MVNQLPTVLIMAAGTGGHVFPALAIAGELKHKSATVHWLGTPNGMENDLLKGTGIPLHQIKVSGLRGSGLRRKMSAPFMLISAFFQSVKVLREISPDCVLGMGGFVCGPAGLAAKLLQMPLLIHEQNAVSGLTNRLLSKVANRVLQAFPGTFRYSSRVLLTGNPVRPEIVNVKPKEPALIGKDAALNLLVLGGSQGAAAINEVIPEFLSKFESAPVNVLHQTGKGKVDDTKQAYLRSGFEVGGRLNIQAFITDMPMAYSWADLVICRSGASTVSELAAAWKASILIPYPYHRDNQQTFNAHWLADAGAAIVVQQVDLTSSKLQEILEQLINQPDQLNQMSKSAGQLAIRNASEVIANECMGAINV